MTFQNPTLSKLSPAKGFFWCFNRRAIKKRGERKRKREEKGGEKEEKEGEKRETKKHFHFTNSISLSQDMALICVSDGPIESSKDTNEQPRR